jgi:serine/threonine protein kinase
MPLQYYIQGTNEALVIEDKPFASGGEGGLYRILQPAGYAANYVAKVIHPNKLSPEREAKVRYLISNRPKFEYQPDFQPIVWVDRAFNDDKNKFAGFVMPRAQGEKLEILCSPRMPKHLGKEWKEYALGTETAMRLRLRVCYNLAMAVQQVHATRRYTLVDLKPDNVMILPDGRVALVDMDSVEAIEAGHTVFAATVATPDYTPAEYYHKGMEPGKKPIPEEWDRFSLAVIFYRILLGIHPFAATCLPPYDNLSDLAGKIKYGFFPHDEGKKAHFAVIPKPHGAFWNLDEDIRFAFAKTFDEGHDMPQARTSAEDWVNILANHPLLLVERPLPSTRLAIPDLSKQDWYELAVQRTLIDLKIIDDPNRSPGTTTVSTGAQLSFMDSAKKVFAIARSAGGVVLPLLFFAGLVTAFTGTFPLFLLVRYGAILALLGVLGFVAATAFVFNNQSKAPQAIGEALDQLAATANQVKENIYKKIKNRKRLEDTQHELFTKRTQAKERLQELSTELGVIEQIKQKRVREFQRTQAQTVQRANAEVSNKLSENNHTQNYDQRAQEIMQRETQEMKQIRQDTEQLLNTHPIFGRIAGKSLAQKRQEIDTFLKQTEPALAGKEFAQKVEQLEMELDQIQADQNRRMEASKKQYDVLHQALWAEAETYKKQIERQRENGILEVRKLTKLDTMLFDDSYKEILKTHKQLSQEVKGQEQALDAISEDVRMVREAIAALP